LGKEDLLLYIARVLNIKVYLFLEQKTICYYFASLNVTFMLCHEKMGGFFKKIFFGRKKEGKKPKGPRGKAGRKKTFLHAWQKS